MDDQIKIRIKPPHDRIDDVNDQTDIKFIKQKEFNANIVKRLEELQKRKPEVIVVDKKGRKL